MKRKDRQAILEHMVGLFERRHPGWARIENPPDLPYLAIFLTRRVDESCLLFIGFYNWKREICAATVGWLSREWHPRIRELVVRYLEEDGTLKQIKLRGTKDFDYADFERGVGGLIPVSIGLAKPYDATMENYHQVSEDMLADIEGAGFEYLDLMLQHRFGKRLSDVLPGES